MKVDTIKGKRYEGENDLSALAMAKRAHLTSLPIRQRERGQTR
jgi:hypothetical protein